MAKKVFMIRIGNKHVRHVLKQHWESNRRKWMRIHEVVDEKKSYLKKYPRL